LLNFHSQDDIWDIYAPLNALSRVEEAAQKNFEYIAANHHYRVGFLNLKGVDFLFFLEKKRKNPKDGKC
jgi:hypothetical protein